MKAVRYDRFGGLEVLEVREVETPRPGAGEVLVQVRAAGINPGETGIRVGGLAERFPSTFPSGQGSDLAGVVSAVGEHVDDWSVGDEVVGWVDTRSSHAEFVVVPARQLARKPESVPWEVAGALVVAGSTAWAAVDAVDPKPGETVAVSAAAGGVGGIASQLAAERGATVLGIAGPSNHDWLTGHGIEPIDYTDGFEKVAQRIEAAAPDGVDAFVDTFGQGYVDLAIGLGVPADRINTVIDYAAVADHGVKAAANAEGANPEVLAELVARLGDGRLDLPVAQTYPLAQVRNAYAQLEERHTRGKIVLIP